MFNLNEKYIEEDLNTVRLSMLEEYTDSQEIHCFACDICGEVKDVDEQVLRGEQSICTTCTNLSPVTVLWITLLRS